MEVVSLKLMYLCHVLYTLSKHFLTFNVAWLTKSNVMRWSITLASFAFVWFIFFKVLQKGESICSSQPNQNNDPQLVHQLLEETTTKSLKCEFLAMDTLTFEVRCRPKQSSLVTIFWTLVPLNCEAVVNQTDCETHGSWLKDAFTIISICPSLFVGSPPYFFFSSF